MAKLLLVRGVVDVTAILVLVLVLGLASTLLCDGITTSGLDGVAGRFP